MGSIRERLLCAEDQCFSAMAVGGSDLDTFSDWWIALCDDVQAAIASLALDEDTLLLAATVSSRVEDVASSFEAMLNATSSMEASMTTELENVFSQLAIEDIYAGEYEANLPWDTTTTTSSGAHTDHGTFTLLMHLRRHDTFSVSYFSISKFHDALVNFRL